MQCDCRQVLQAFGSTPPVLFNCSLERNLSECPAATYFDGPAGPSGPNEAIVTLSELGNAGALSNSAGSNGQLTALFSSEGINPTEPVSSLESRPLTSAARRDAGCPSHTCLTTAKSLWALANQQLQIVCISDV